MEASGLRTTSNEETQAQELYSSDEETQQLSDAACSAQQAFLREVAGEAAMEAGIWILAPEAKVPQMLLKFGKKLKLGKQVRRGGNALIQVKNSKVGREVAQRIEEMGGRMLKTAKKGITVLQSTGHTLSNRTLQGLGLNREKARRALEDLKEANNLGNSFHGQILQDGDFIDPHTREIFGNIYDYLK